MKGASADQSKMPRNEPFDGTPVWSVAIGITDNTPCVAPRVAAGPAPFEWTDHQTIA
jgi:hypothetical protein